MNRPLKFDLLKVGHCIHPECIAMRGGRWQGIEFPALVGLIEHPSLGFMLYDTGYSRHFMAATRSFPECLYRKVTPPSLPAEEELIAQLAARQITPDQIGTIFISHFHADHVAGLKDFPKARFIATKEEYREVRSYGRLRRLQNAFLSDLLPADFEERAHYAEDGAGVDLPLPGFGRGYDLLGDGSLMGVPLPGHTRSHLGLLFQDASGRKCFLIGDACWKIEALRGKRLPSRLASWLFADKRRYAETFLRLAALHAAEPSVTIIPSHCVTTWERFGNTRHVSHDA